MITFIFKKSENGGIRMGFNYSREKLIFDREWEKLRGQYKKAGMNDEVIQELYDFDWSWFRMRRNYENRVQAMPEEEIDEQNAETRSNLFQRFTSLYTSFDVMELSGRYAWINTISDDALSRKLRDLSDYELELLTLLALEGYTQREIARKMHCSQNAISKRLIKIKRILKEK
jgi:DNA-binding CsgD family transcriptional regulator